MSEVIIGHEKQLEKINHLVESQRVPHLFLFVGPSGVGKKKLAFALSRKLGCNDGSTMFIEPEGLNIKIDQAREVLEFCHLAHQEKARMIIIDQAEKMNQQTSNALLKLFEEPPPQTYFVLLAPSPSSVLTTIRSRAQVLSFGSLTVEELRRGLPEAPDWVLQSSGGRFDRAEALQNEDLLELRSEALKLMKVARESNRADVVEALKLAAPNREKALWLVKFWREFIRDAWMEKQGLQKSLHGDLANEISSLLPLTSEGFSDLAEATQRLEVAISSGFDIQMSLENYLVGLSQ
jgi:DNA polymerase-3 subunit delta'